jgi:hypothetical protein
MRFAYPAYCDQPLLVGRKSAAHPAIPGFQHIHRCHHAVICAMLLVQQTPGQHIKKQPTIHDYRLSGLDRARQGRA